MDFTLPEGAELIDSKPGSEPGEYILLAYAAENVQPWITWTYVNNHCWRGNYFRREESARDNFAERTT